MTDKLIRVTSCSDCDKKTRLNYNLTYTYWCKEKKLRIEEYIESETIHPDCPLDNVTNLVQSIMAVWEIEMGRKPLDQEKHLKLWDGYRKMIAEGHKSSLPRDWFESILDYITELENAICETIKFAEGEK